MGEMLWKFLHSFTPSPRRPRPLGGSVINGTIQQLLDTPRAEPVTTNLAGDATQRHTAAQRGFIHEDVARPPQRLVRGWGGYFSPMGNLEKQSKGINP